MMIGIQRMIPVPVHRQIKTSKEKRKEVAAGKKTAGIKILFEIDMRMRIIQNLGLMINHQY